MNEVTRYDLDQYEGEWATMREDELGDYVLASDYDQLKADNEAYKNLHNWLKAENEQLREKTSVMMGVGRGDGQLFVHGDYDSIKAAQAIVLERGALREQLNEARELLETCKLFYGCEHVKGMDDWLEANKP